MADPHQFDLAPLPGSLFANPAVPAGGSRAGGIYPDAEVEGVEVGDILIIKDEWLTVIWREQYAEGLTRLTFRADNA